MSRVLSKNTKPELLVRKFLHRNGFRFRLNDKKLAGKPDIVLPKYKTVVFVNGCFWHGHQKCKYATLPKTKSKWWSNKISGNIENDKKKSIALRKAGWKVIKIWTCQLKKQKSDKALKKLLTQLEKNSAC